MTDGLRVNEKIIARTVREYLPFIATENLLMEEDGSYVELPKKLWDDLDKNDGPEHGRFSPDATYPNVGTQTNYDGNGVITEQTIQGILDTAIALGNGGQ